MKLPNGDKALVSKNKLLGYVLSPVHELGKFKAKYFNNLGFFSENVQVFEKTLLRIAKTGEVNNFIKTPYGIKYILNSKIKTPVGKVVSVRTLWIIDINQKIPRFVTIYPL